MQTTRWAILGPGSIATWFAHALASSRYGRLTAVASRNTARAREFADRFGAEVAGTYAEVLARDDIDAVYISTVHTTHAELSIAALRADKAVLCEKPASPNTADTERVLEAASAAGRPYIEAYKHLFGPMAEALDEVVRGGTLGGPLHVRSAFGFEAPVREGRLFDPALAGGAILDVGGYPVSFAVRLAAAAGLDPATLAVTEASGTLDEHGVDLTTRAVISGEGFTADVACAITENMPQDAHLSGPSGSLELPNAFGVREFSPPTYSLEVGGERSTVEVEGVVPFAAEADALSLALAEGRLEAPEMTWAHTRAVARLLEEWRARLS